MKIPNDMNVGCIHQTSHGDVVVVGYDNSKKVRVRFIDTGYEVDTNTQNIRAGKIKDRLTKTVYGVGCIGDGKHKPTSGRRKTKAYSTWCGIIDRCYSSNDKESYRWYGDCSVSDEWLNFQNFADWYESQINANRECFDVDKDILIHGNRVYSEDACMLVHKDINYLFTCRSESDLPAGVCYDKLANGYRSNCYHSGVEHRIYTKDLKEACDHYVIEKLNSVKIAHHKHYSGDDFMKEVLKNKLISFLEDNGHEQASHLIKGW